MPDQGATQRDGERARSGRTPHWPALDGVRGLAILGVLSLHLHFAVGGFVGVPMFFVLSGFLITTLLVLEYEKTGRVDLKRFYARRALRLLPGLYVACAAYALYVMLVAPYPLARLTLAGAASAIGYVSNWAAVLGWSRLGLLVHTWSLSTEEQFYLIWPLTLLLVVPFLFPRRRVGAVTLVLVAVAGGAFARAFVFKTTGPSIHYQYGLDTNADYLLIGCAIGLLWTSGFKLTRAWQTRALRGASALSVIYLCLVAIFVPKLSAFFAYGGLSAVGIATGVLILQLVVVPWRATSWLESRPLVFTGRISYELYLWHILIFWTSHASPVVKLALVFVVATASYRWVEAPFLRRKSRLAVVGTEASRATSRPVIADDGPPNATRAELGRMAPAPSASSVNWGG